MRIVCPACAAAYDVPRDRLPPGLVVRCARCGGDWSPPEAAELEPAASASVPVESEPKPEPALAAEPEAAPEPAPAAMPAFRVPVAAAPALLIEPASERDEPAAGRERAALALAWVLSALLLAGAVWASVAEREQVMRAWPASERAYAALGLAGRH